MSKLTFDPFSVFGKFILTIMLLIVLTLVNGLTFKILWSWFIVTTLHAPAITVPVALGFSLMITFLMERIDTSKTKTSEPETKAETDGLWMKFAKNTFSRIAMCCLYLALGWFCKLWM